MPPHRGHLFDSQRSASPPYISSPLPVQAEKWQPWVPRPPSAASTSHSLISSSQLDNVFGAYSQSYDHAASLARRATEHPDHAPSLWAVFINNPWVPAVIRITMFALSCVTLGLCGRLTYLNTHLPAAVADGPGTDEPVCVASPVMAMVLAALAICYLPYIFYDEYFGAPVGVRSPLSKARLLFFDLTFVVLYAVDVTLAADEAFTDGCTSRYMTERTVFALILLTIVAWVGTFSLTLVRLIARIGAGLQSGRA